MQCDRTGAVAVGVGVVSDRAVWQKGCHLPGTHAFMDLWHSNPKFIAFFLFCKELKDIKYIWQILIFDA